MAVWAEWLDPPPVDSLRARNYRSLETGRLGALVSCPCWSVRLSPGCNLRLVDTWRTGRGYRTGGAELGKWREWVAFPASSLCLGHPGPFVSIRIAVWKRRPD
ncbi:unnamed protein product [Cuscuta europaea]|uniref:Uncharacterized protein n=1 Tax=Cuscuta europaea TaxID=41803 RepID=A0A9P0YM60_CUSEU|nr:unnamed protein product [Cuscuta europaea]